ncbi:uncharacterized protein LOC121380244 [Gigantopelta aegis]|uniref:uncharacterized protein LOC121380244 n=1 Tax=Gigantopelta aegis TaxID=1735272 RepID=UPI001B88E5D5|nr:uncharacterized protein LOC121380244 [Gigantopelta aegis]
MAAAEDGSYYGTWRIVECVSLAGTVETTGIEGTEFHLDENGDVSWKISEDAEPMPFFNCETYEVTPQAGTSPALLKFIWTYEGHVIEFRVEVADDLMLLTYERCCMLQCQKVSSNDPRAEEPFSLLGALEEGYFSDLVVKADSGREFKVHSVILQLSCPEMDWSSNPPPLTGLKADVLEATLHYLYAECLPRGLSEDTAKACIKSVGKLPGFVRFSDLCDTFLKNAALKQQIISLITDMHGCADRIIELFTVKGANSVEGHFAVDSSLVSNPAKLCYVVRQALREAAVACAKLLILCDLFSKRKGELSREERHEIMKYAKSRLPIFMNQLHRFLEVCKEHADQLSVAQREEIANYLVPELEVTLEMMSKFAMETKAALEQIISASNAVEKSDRGDKYKKSHMGDVLGKALRNALHIKELKKLKSFHDRTTTSFMHLMQRKEHFCLMTQREKVRATSKNLEQLADEVPHFLTRLKELMSALDEKVTWREWKYLFKLGTSKVAWGLGKVLSNKSTMQSLIDQVCDMANREQFTMSLAALGLVTTEPSPEGASITSKTSQPGLTKYAQLSSIESLCIPPHAHDSQTASKALSLLKTGHNTDMTFEIRAVHDGGDIVIDHTKGGSVTRVEEGEVEVEEVRAHCVIIAARCDWFRRALLSGMKESIHKKITVHDTNPELFQLFLEYLYSGHLETSELSTEQLADMMTLCDRYETDSVKSLCEHALKDHVDDETALYLLSLTDQLHCKTLREHCLQYIMEHPSLADSEVFEDLPEHLQAEVEDTIAWRGLEPRSFRLPGDHVVETPISVSPCGDSEVDELMTNLDLGDAGQDISTSSSSDEMPFMEDSTRLERCIDALKDIVGDTVPRDELVRVALAADYDINRALNFFFS